MSISAEQVQAWVAQNEGQTVEFKLESVTQTEVAEAVASFANGSGGVLLIGVRDDQTILGVRQLKDVVYMAYAAAHTITPRLDEQVKVEDVEVDGRRVVVVIVPDDCADTYLAGSGYRQRQGAKNVLMTAQAVAEHVRLRAAIPFDRQPLPATTFASLSEEKLTTFLRERSGQNRPDLGALNVRAGLRNLHVLADVEGSHPTVAGLLMFGRAPQQHLPQAILQCVRFRGRGVNRFLDRIELSTTIDEQVDKAVAFVQRNIRHGTYIEQVRHVNVDEYPLTAIREALINALCHRDYYAEGTAVNLSIFSKRNGSQPQHLQQSNRDSTPAASYPA